MGKINSALHEIKTLDELAAKNQWVNQIHPLVKLLITLLYITLAVSFSKYDLFGLLGMAVYPLLLFELAEVSFPDALRRLRVILPVVCIVGVFNPFFDRAVIAEVGGVSISGGVVSMLTLMVKGVLTVLASYLLIVTTGMERICYALEMLHLPQRFITQLMLIYRYISVLLEEAHRMSQAYALRAPGQNGIHYKAWGSFIGQLLLRSMDRAEIIYESMSLRGFRGSFSRTSEPWSATDTAYLLFWCAVLTVFRLVPVLVLVGNLFV